MTARIRIIGIVAICLQLVACGGGGSGGGGPMPITGAGVERIDQAMNGVMDRHGPPGIAVAVVRNGKLVAARAYGHADLAGTETLRPDHLFRVASVSKPITAIAALKAADEGLLDLQAKAFDLLASYLPGDGSEDPRLGDITVWHLLHHTGGWNLYGYPDDPLFQNVAIANAMNVPAPPDPQTLTRWVAGQPLAFDPGTGFHYTNIGFVVLGRVIESATGFQYEDFVRRFVFEPVGVTTARLGGTLRSERYPGEVEYESFSGAIWKSVFNGAVVSEPAYGALNLLGFDASSAWVLSVVDLARLAAAVDSDGAYPELLTPQRFEQMISVGTPPNTAEVGAAWFLTTANGVTQGWNHAGGMPGTASYVERMRSGIIMIVATNTSRDDPFFEDLIGGLRDAVNGVTEWPDVDLFPGFE